MLFLWGQNVSEVVGADVWPIVGRVVGGTLAAAVVAALAFRDVRRGALFASVAAVLFLSYGHVAGGAAPWIGVAVLLALVAATIVGLVLATRRVVGGLTRVANVVSGAMLLTTAFPLGQAALAEEGGSLQVPEELAGRTDGPVRDIYYIIPDRYGREDSLQEVFGYDNGAFVRMLERHGFDVLDGSLANYPKTAHSVAATLNMTYLDELEATVSDDAQADWQPVYRLLTDHRVGELLTGLGYEYLHLGSWWGPTATAASADRILTYDTASEFQQVFEQTTALPAFQDLLGIDTALGLRELKRAHSEHQLDQLERLAREPHTRPRFVLAHITLPHEPYVFEPDGSWVPEDVEAARSRTENYTRQLDYLNRRLEDLVAALLDRPADERPIVVIQSDEGPHPVNRVEQGPGYSWIDAPLADQREKLRNVAAYHLPGVSDEDIPEDLTPVNTFRLILGRYFGMDLPLLEDRVFLFPHEEQLYRFVEVTDRIRG